MIGYLLRGATLRYRRTPTVLHLSWGEHVLNAFKLMWSKITASSARLRYDLERGVHEKNDVNKELPLRARCEIPHKLRKPYLCHFSNLAVMINARSLHKGAQAANASLGDQRNTCTRGDSFVMLRYSVLLPPPNSRTDPWGGKFCGTEILHTFIFNHTLQVEKCEGDVTQVHLESVMELCSSAEEMSPICSDRRAAKSQFVLEHLL